MKDELDLDTQVSIFKKKARKLHNGKYDYSLVEYVEELTPVSILCPHHGIFHQKPHFHLITGSGCPKCVSYTPHNILYLFKCNNTDTYKIGITTNNIQKRLKSLGGSLSAVFHVWCNNAFKEEQILHKRYKYYNMYNETVNGGNTEFFLLTEEQVQEVINYMKEL